MGLNHEMARQLLWNDYPTDQRGSYFRQFWDVSAYVPQPGDPTDPAALAELLKDIPPIHTWPLPTALGTHPEPHRHRRRQRRAAGARRAVQALSQRHRLRRQGRSATPPAARVLDDTDERYPDLPRHAAQRHHLPRLQSEPAEDAQGGTAQSPDGFFFVFQQQPSEPRFGLEPWKTQPHHPLGGTGMDELCGGGGGPPFQLPDLGLTTRAQTIKQSPWRLASQVFSLVVSGTSVPDFLSPSLAPVRVAIAADANDPDDPANQWGVNSAQTAYILLRLPFRILIHADLMLPAS